MSGEAEIRKKKIYRVTFIGFAVNLLLAGIKLAAGILGRSGAMVADAVHSFSDMATDVVVIAFAKISAKPKDEGHDYGHGKYETLATIIISLALAAVGTGILVNSIGAIRVVVDGGLLPRPGTVALLAAAVSIVVKEILYRYTVREGRRVSSPSMIANAWHHRSDALSSLGTLAGIGCAYFLGDKWRIADPIAALVVAVFIFKIACRCGESRSAGAAQPAHAPYRRVDRRRGACARGRRDERLPLARADRGHRTPPARPVRRRHDDLHSCRAAQGGVPCGVMPGGGADSREKRRAGSPASSTVSP